MLPVLIEITRYQRFLYSLNYDRFFTVFIESLLIPYNHSSTSVRLQPIRHSHKKGALFMIHLFLPLIDLLGHPALRLIIIAVSFVCKLSILLWCIKYSTKTAASRLLFFLFMLFLSITLFEDAHHLISRFVFNILLKKGPIPQLEFLRRVTWILFITQYQAMAFLLEYLSSKRIRITSFLNIVSCILNIVISGGFLFIALYNYQPLAAGGTRDLVLFWEIKLTQICYVYLPLLFAPKLYAIYKKIQTKELPTILTYQLKYLIGFLIPYLFLETINSSNSYLGRPFSQLFSNATQLIFPLATILSTCAIYFLSKRMM